MYVLIRKTIEEITMNIEKMEISEIQFFDYSEQLGENSNELNLRYSANIILDNKLVIQLSGDSNESHRPYVPDSHECYYNDHELQDKASEDLDIDDVIEYLENHNIENNYYFLSENS